MYNSCVINIQSKFIQYFVLSVTDKHAVVWRIPPLKKSLSQAQSFLQLDKQRYTFFKKSFTYFCVYKMLFVLSLGWSGHESGSY